MKRFLLAAALSVSAAVCISGCGADTQTAQQNNVVENTTDKAKEALEKEENSEEAMEEDYTTGDASLDNIRNQDGIGENELLVISFGTSYNDNRRNTIGAIENELEKAFSDFSVRRGFTSDIIIKHINKRDNVMIDNVDAALKRAVDNKVKRLVIQPTHLMSGFEYDELKEKVAEYSDAFERVEIGKPLLTTDDDFKRVEQAIIEQTKEYNDGKTAVCFMGHGTEAQSNEVYSKMQRLLEADGYNNYFIGTVEAEPTLEEVVEKVKAAGYERAVLQPLMVVAGDHANNDMAGDEEDSWRSMFEKEGIKVECVLKGLGEIEEIRNIYVEHARTAIAELRKH